MAESSTTNQEADASPRHFVAFGRLIGGLLITTAGGFGLHYSTGPEITTFACVATVSGVILNLWGFAGTVLHPKATREDCFWAIAFLLLFCVSLAGNVFFNSFDYGVPFVGLEVAIASAAFCLAWLIAVSTRVLYRKNLLLPLHHRRRMLVAGIIGLLLAWILIRPVIVTKYHVMALVDPNNRSAALTYERIAILKRQPHWYLRWAFCRELKSPDILRTIYAINYIEQSQEISVLFSAQELEDAKARVYAKRTP